MCIEQLKPSQLLKIPVQIGNINAEAMIDSGTKLSYIKLSLVEKVNLKIDSSERKMIIGYGNNKKETEGITMVELKIRDVTFNQEFNVLGQCNAKYDIILGVDFLEQKKVVVDAAKRIVRIGKSSNENYTFHLDEENTIDEISYNKIPVYAIKDYTVKGEENEVLEVEVSNMPNEVNFYFEGKSDNNLVFYCGIMNDTSKK